MTAALLSLMAAVALGLLVHLLRGGVTASGDTRRALGAAALALGALLLLFRQVTLAMGFLAAGGALLMQAGLRRRRGGARRVSTVRSRVFEMTLDQDSGDMDGVVLTGPQEGRRLSTMTRDELLALAGALDADDADSLNLLRAYLDRAHPGWTDAPEPPPAGGDLSRAEALALLGLAEGATRAEIVAAHKRLSKKLHPDAGGSAALSAQINRARDILLGGG